MEGKFGVKLRENEVWFNIKKFLTTPFESSCRQGGNRRKLKTGNNALVMHIHIIQVHGNAFE